MSRQLHAPVVLARLALIAAAALLLMACDKKPEEAGCGKDTDCKGNRICERGVCVDRSEPTLPAQPSPAPIETIAVQVCHRLEAAGVVTKCERGAPAFEMYGEDHAQFEFVRRPYPEGVPCGQPGEEPCVGEVIRFFDEKNYQAMFARDAGYHCGVNADCYGSAKARVVVVPGRFGPSGDHALEAKIRAVVDAL